MHIRIVEGIATSGKSTIIDELKKCFEGDKLAVYTEADTHIPIRSERKELHVQFFSDLIDRAIGSGAQIILFDRLYMTQAFRAGVMIAAYASIERRLALYDTQTILLEVDSGAIAGRLERAMEHRDDTWRAYVRSRAESTEAAAVLYDAQQYAMRNFAASSLLPSLTFNTTNHEYKAIVAAICAGLPLF